MMPGALERASRVGTLVVCLAFSLDASAGDANADAFVSCAARYATSLSGEIQPDALREIVGDARLVALGEPAHGARAPLELRNRVIKYLVEHLGFTAIALETAFGESRAVYEFVTQGADASRAQSVAREGLTWGFGVYPENADLIRWVHDYNADPAHSRKVHFYGIDLNGADDRGSFSRARDAVDRSLDVLAKAAPVQAKELKARTEPALALFSDEKSGQLSSAQDQELEKTLGSIADGFRAHRSALISSIGRERYEWAVQELVVAQKLQAYFRAAPESASTGGELPSDGYKQDEIRDAAMAENVRWVLKQEGAEGRVLVFAHNAHVMNARLRGGMWSVYPGAPRAMGDYLRAAMGNSLVIIGTLAATDAPESTEGVLAHVGPPPFLLDLHKAACNTSAGGWLAQRRSIRANYQTYLDVELQSAFDAIVYLNRIERRK